MSRGVGLTKEALQSVYPFAFYYLHLMKLGAALTFSDDEIKILERVDTLDKTLVFEDLKVFADPTRYFLRIFDHVYAVLLSKSQFNLFKKLMEVGKYDFFSQPTNEALKYNNDREVIKFVVDDLTALLKSHFLSEKIKKEGAAFIKKYEDNDSMLNGFTPFEIMERARIKLSLMVFESLIIQFKEKVNPSNRKRVDKKKMRQIKIISAAVEKLRDIREKNLNKDGLGNGKN